MHIRINDRFRPYSHLPGTVCVLPSSTLGLQVYPARILFYDLAQPLPRFLYELTADLSGPVRDFTVSLDLEKGWIKLWGDTPGGYFRYRLNALTEGTNQWKMDIEKTPSTGICWASSESPMWVKGPDAAESVSLAGPVYAGDQISFIKLETQEIYHPPANLERLSLGNHKAPDWEMVKRRGDLTEIFPIWHRLGQMIPQQSKTYPPVGTAWFLQQCQRSIEAKVKDRILNDFRHLWMAGFQGILSPTMEDPYHQGFALPPVPSETEISSLLLLQEGSRLIRSLFFQSEGENIHILPLLPAEFHSGKMSQLVCDKKATLEIEWTKKNLRRMIIKAEADATLQLTLPKEIKRYRLREQPQAHGKKVICPMSLSIEQGKSYYLDNFET